MTPLSEQRKHVFEYALLRVIPRVDRGERVNAGVLLYCRDREFLDARVWLDPERLRALDPTADPEVIDQSLRGIAADCATDPDSGLKRREELGRRFRWLAAPRSTVVQPGSVHTGRTGDPEAELDHLLNILVLPLR